MQWVIRCRVCVRIQCGSQLHGCLAAHCAVLSCSPTAATCRMSPPLCCLPRRLWIEAQPGECMHPQQQCCIGVTWCALIVLRKLDALWPACMKSWVWSAAVVQLVEPQPGGAHWPHRMAVDIILFFEVHTTPGLSVSMGPLPGGAGV